MPSIESRRRPAELTTDSDSIQQRERCPRCDSTDTKFCYYNNYNTCQPRHFCKSCRRYWTLGGSLRNVPIGGSSRKRIRTNQFPKPARVCNGTGIVPPYVFGQNGFLHAPLVGFGGPFVGFELGLGVGSRSSSGLSYNGLDETEWPLSLMNEQNVDMWKMEIGRMEDHLPVPASDMWQELALSVPTQTACSLEAHLM